MTHLLARLAQEDNAQDLIEYALLSSLLAVACISGILGLSGVREFLERAGKALRDAL